jgi:endonuclease/exonuclease/phosphatase family metal-dependent hydrolase
MVAGGSDQRKGRRRAQSRIDPETRNAYPFPADTTARLMKYDPTLRTTGLASLLLALATSVFFSCAPTTAEVDVDGPRIAVVTQNIGDIVPPRPSTDDIAYVFRQLPTAQVYLLQEVGGFQAARRIAEALSSESAQYDHIYTRASGVAVVTSLEILDYKVPPDAAVIRATLDAGNGETLRVASIHLPAFRKPRQGDGDAKIGPVYGALRLAREAITPNGRSRAADRILEWLDGGEPPPATVIGGDLNTIPLTLAPRRIARTYTDSLRGSGDFWTGTYRRMAGPVGARVDFLFHSRHLQVVDSFVLQETAGDHYPVYAEYAFKSDAHGGTAP